MGVVCLFFEAGSVFFSCHSFLFFDGVGWAVPACSKRFCSMATVGLVWCFSMSFIMEMTPWMRLLIRLSRVWALGPMDSSGHSPLSSKHRSRSSKVMDCDLDSILQYFRNLRATDFLILNPAYPSFSNSLSIFS